MRIPAPNPMIIAALLVVVFWAYVITGLIHLFQ